jgi:hypothetical protein
MEDNVRLLKYSKTSVNAYARVADIKKDRILLSNFNMPYQGTISRYFTKKEFEQLTRKTF